MGEESLYKRASQWLTNVQQRSVDYQYIPLSNINNSNANLQCLASGHDPGEDSSAYELLLSDQDADKEVKGSILSDEVPTETELHSLRRIPDAIPLAAFTIVIVELCERFSFFGLTGVFQNYLQYPLPLGGNGAGAPASVDDKSPAGALNLGQSRATAVQQLLATITYLFPLLGAIIADAKWGRYKTITVFCAVYFVGLVIITMTSLPPSLKAGWGLSGWLVGTVIVAMGTGGIKANVAPLVADQYRTTSMSVRTLSTGERVIVDPNVTISRIYNIFYWCINVGSLSSIITTQLERRVGFWAAYALPTCMFLITPIVLISGSKLYHKVPPRGSIIIEVLKVIRIAFKGMLRDPLWYLREVRIFGLWDRTKPSFLSSSADAEYRKIPASSITWDDAFVEEIKRTAGACQISMFLPLYWAAFGQMGTNLISMAASMTTNGTPNDFLANVNPISLILLIPIMDILIYPALRLRGIHLRPVFKIWLGFMFATLAMAYSAFLQHWIYQTNPCGEYVGTCDQPSSISVWLEAPCYVLLAISEVFASITALEYSYNKAPKRMKSVAMSVFLFSSALGSLFCALLAPFAQDPNLVLNYIIIALGTFVGGNVFYACFRHRDKNEEMENAIGRDNLDDRVSATS